MKKKNEKKTFNDVLTYCFYGFHNVTFAEAIEALKEAEEAALEEVKSYNNPPEYEIVDLRIQEGDEGFYTIHAKYQETDEAYRERLKKEKSVAKELKQREQKEREQKEREEYERLKEKFEKDREEYERLKKKFEEA